MTTRQRRTYWTAAGILLATLAIGLMVAGGGKAATKSTAPPPPEVGVIHVMGEDVSTYREYPARTYARDLVEVRGRVDGYVVAVRLISAPMCVPGKSSMCSMSVRTRRRSSALMALWRKRPLMSPRPKRHFRKRSRTWSDSSRSSERKPPRSRTSTTRSPPGVRPRRRLPGEKPRLKRIARSCGRRS